jgi:RNA polymerase sigma-70 factor, ECF subfamily
MNSDATSYFPGPIPDDLRSDGLGCTRPDLVSLPGSSDHSFTTAEICSAAGVSDDALLEQLHSGDKEALAILFRRYARMVRAVAYRILRDPSEADDLLQEVFLFIFRKSALFDAARGSARSWIVQVTYHRAIDRRRHLAARHFYTSVEIDDDSLGVREPRAEIAFYEQSMEGMLGKEMVRRMDEALSMEQRRVIQLYFFEGYTLEEIACKVGQALGNIRNHYYRGLEKMRQQIFPSKLRPK